MKLYATVTSERASKGQGGNKFLFVDFTVGEKTTHIGQIELELLDEGLEEREWLLKWRFAEDDDWEILKQGHIRGQTKGNKQKGEKCDNCGREIEQAEHKNGKGLCSICIDAIQ